MPKADPQVDLKTSERAGAETPPPVCVSEKLDRGVYVTRLASGAQIWTERMDSLRSAAVGFWFRSGAAHEPSHLAGSAHLLEHMVFKGTASRSARQIAAEIEDLGGSLDAYTTHEHTAFLARVPDEELATAVDVLADLSFSPTLDAGDLELEREVVLEEIARCEDTPDDLVFDLQAEFLYGNHPYGRPILGIRESVQAIDAVSLRSLHADTFRPSNLIVAAAGRIDHQEVVDLVAERLSDDAVRPPTGIDKPTSLGSGLKRVARPGGRQTHIVAAAPGVSIADPIRHAVVLVGTALGGGMGSRLFQRIREELGLAYAVYSFQSFYQSGGHVGAYLGTRQETAEQALSALSDELGRLSRLGLSADELGTTRRQLKGQVVLALESPGSRMHRLASLALTDEPYRSLDQIMARIDGITVEDTARAAKLYDPDRLAILQLSPA